MFNKSMEISSHFLDFGLHRITIKCINQKTKHNLRIKIKKAEVGFSTGVVKGSAERNVSKTNSPNLLSPFISLGFCRAHFPL